MSLFTRIGATLRARLDAAVCQIEDHDAVVDALLSEARAALARARARLSRLDAGIDQLQRRQQELERGITDWTRRAAALADSDEAGALECLRQRARSREALAECSSRLEQQRAARSRLASDLDIAERRYRERQSQHALLRGRAASAEALAATRALDAEGLSGLDDTFERWEARLFEREAHVDIDSDPGERLARRYAEAERESALRAELVALRGGEH